MIAWKMLKDEAQINQIQSISQQTPCVIFKHSGRCSMSKLIKMRLEDDWDFSEQAIQPFFLDVPIYRVLARTIAEVFEVHHESPQLLLIRDGVCTYDATDFDITVSELHECYADTF